MKRTTFEFVLLSVALILGLLTNAQSAVVDGKRFVDRIQLEQTSLELVGTGLLRYFGFKAYVGAFYLAEGSEVEDALQDTAKRIELEYMRSIKGEDFGPATVKSLQKNLDAETLKTLRTRIDYHNSLYEDVQPGDRYSLTYVPGRGTELALNGEPKGVIEGADFAAAIFSIWLGAEPIDESFKQQILGLSR